MTCGCDQSDKNYLKLWCPTGLIKYENLWPELVRQPPKRCRASRPVLMLRASLRSVRDFAYLQFLANENHCIINGINKVRCGNEGLKSLSRFPSVVRVMTDTKQNSNTSRPDTAPRPVSWIQQASIPGMYAYTSPLKTFCFSFIDRYYYRNTNRN